jgi:SSS family solute:Na+ symporter
LSIHAAIATGLGLYACLMLAMSAFWMTRVKKAADYLVAGRSLPFWVLTGTITATCIGTGVVIGAPGLAYRYGWAGSAYPLGLGLGTAVTGLLFASTRRYKFMTLGEEIACYYGQNRVVAEFSNLSLFFSQLCWLTVQIMGVGSVLGAVTGLRPQLCVVFAGLIMAAISIPGGLKTVVYTDVLNATILLCGFGALTYSSLSHAGGLDGLRRAAPAANFTFLGFASYGAWAVVGLILTLVLAVVADPGRRLTMYSARTEASARWSMVTAGVIVMIFSSVVGIIGMYAFKLNAHLLSPDESLPWLVAHVLPSWLAALVVVSMTAAIVSCANANAAAVGTLFVRHIFPLMTGRYAQGSVAIVRRILAVAFVVCTAVALHAGTIVGFVIKFLPITMSGLAVIILSGRFWPRATWQGALAALGVTPVVSLALMFQSNRAGFWHNPTLVSAVAGVLALVAVSALTRREQHGFAQIAGRLAREREAVEEDSPELDRPSNGAAPDQ